MDDKQLQIYYKFRHLSRNCLYVVGFWPNNDSSSLYTIVPYFHIVLCSYTLFGIFGFFKKYITNVLIATSMIGPLVGGTTIPLKIMSMLRGYKELDVLRNYVDVYFNNLMKNKSLRPAILEDVTIYYRFALYCVISVMMLAVLYACLPLIFILIQYLKHASTIKYALPYPTSFPWDINPNTLNYWIHYGVETGAVLSLATVNTCVDAGFTFHIFQLIGLIREISYCLSNLEMDKDYEITIRQCIGQYEIILKLREKIQKIYGPIILLISVSNAIVMCTLIFQVTHARVISVGRLVLFAIYIFFKSFETFTYGWVGTRLTVESENCLSITSDINWIARKKLTALLLIMLPQKSLEIVACEISVVSVNMFLKVMNTAVSYFFLLKTLEEN